MLSYYLALVAATVVGDPVRNGTKALRICRPPPPYTPTQAPACLVIGDSVSLGYTGDLATNLTGTCDVLHAPYSGDGGACDTRYGLQCADLWLGLALGGAASPKYNVITFNFGLHDTNDSGEDEESRDEYVPRAEYGANLLKFVAKVRQWQPQAHLAWLSSTPMHFDMHLNDNVNAYNALARTLLVGGSRATSGASRATSGGASGANTMQGVVDAFLDLNKVVIDACGQPPYYGSKLAPHAKNNCSLISDNEEYHYNTQGWRLLAAHVGKEIRTLLKKGKRPVTDGGGRVDGDSAMCPDGKTSCPAGSTCSADQFADTKWGCCMVDSASSCGDGFHCCGAGTTCASNGTNPVRPNKPSPLSYSHVCINAN